MCGIAGAVWSDPSSAVDAHQLARMAAALRHRGPDDHDVYVDRHAGLAHARLSIIDLTTGRQPLSNEDGTVWVVFNGEIYNFRELRAQLESRGHVFRTASDSEAIVHLYEEDGADCVRKLRGMFALAIWDARRQRLVLARDRLGKKPLVYFEQGDRLAFASEIKALLELPGALREIDPLAVDQYFSYGYVPHPRTIYRGVRKLPPAHYAVYEQGRLRVTRYWSHDDAAEGFDDESLRSEEDYCRRVRDELREATRIRLMSDVPLGAFLSGGIDSTIVVGLMQELSDRPTKTFSIRFSVREYDESQYARRAAKHLGTEHHEFLVEQKCLDVLPDLIWHFDEPFADSSAIPTYYLARLTKQEVTVALSGDGGDEVFCGYDRYQRLWQVGLCDRLPTPMVRMAAGLLRAGVPLPRALDAARSRGRTLCELLSASPRKRVSRMACLSFQDSLRGELYHPDFARELSGSDPLSFVEDAYDSFSGRDAITRATLVDQVTRMPCDILAKVDIATMAHGLECRSPFLDHKVVELAARMPIGMKLRRGRGKYILKRAFADIVPRETLIRPKMGFEVPLVRWFREELREFVRQVLLDPAALARGYFRPDVVERLVRQHQSDETDHSVRLWTLLCFELWHRRFVDVPQTEAACA